MAKKIKVLSMFLALSLLISLACPAKVTEAASASKKKSVTITLTKDDPSQMFYLRLKKQSPVKVTVKVLKAKGTAEKKKIYWLPYEADTSKGSLFYGNLKTKKLKKGQSLTSKTLVSSPASDAEITFDLPEGMTMLKIKVTVSSTKGKKVIQSFERFTY